MTDKEQYKIKRAMAIKQYRFLLKMIAEAKEKGHYGLATKWMIEGASLKEKYNL